MSRGTRGLELVINTRSDRLWTGLRLAAGATSPSLRGGAQLSGQSSSDTPHAREITTSLLRLLCEVALRVLVELPLAPGRAEEVGRPLVRTRASRLLGVDLHAADRIGRRCHLSLPPFRLSSSLVSLQRATPGFTRPFAPDRWRANQRAWPTGPIAERPRIEQRSTPSSRARAAC